MLTITDKFVTMDSAGVQHGPTISTDIFARATELPLFVDEGGGVFRLLEGTATIQADVDDTTGEWTIQLPWPSESDPDTVSWIITMPDGVQWQGHVPEGISGPLTIQELKSLYEWGLSFPIGTKPSYVVLGIRGPTGPQPDLPVEFLLNNDPVSETGGTDAAYAATYVDNLVTLEEWQRADATLIKTIEYTYTLGKVTTEVRKVFDTDGITIIAQVTWTYVYTGNNLTSASMTRDV